MDQDRWPDGELAVPLFEHAEPRDFDDEAPWWWLSFIKPGVERLGVCIVQGRDIYDAVQKAWALGVNPGGEVMGLKFPGPEYLPKPEYRNRFMKQAEAEKQEGWWD
jgi:hypothetical protein